MKKGGLFSLSLYREGLRQTQALGWVLFGLIMGALVLGFVMQFGASLTASAPMTGTFGMQTASFVDLYDGAPLLALLFVWTPIMVLLLFHFVTKRNQCDFYHALPHTRPQLACSFLAAVLTWTLGTLLAAFGIFAILYSCLPDSIAIVNFAGALHSLASTAAILILVTGGSFLAVSLTGTVSSGILATGLILFMPRILLGITTVQAVSTIPVLTVSDLPCPLGSYNLLANFFNITQQSTLHASLGGILYTVLLGALYLGLGLWAFSRRKSERAGLAAISNSAQALLRVLIASPILLGAAVLLVSAFSIPAEELKEFGTTILFGTLSTAFTLLGVSIGVFVLYELFTTRSAKRLLKILPSFGFVIAVALAGALTIVGTKPAVAASVPKAEDIESVSLLPKEEDDLFSYVLGMDGVTYFDAAAKEIAVRDQNAIGAVATALDRNVKQYTETDASLWPLDETGSSARVRIRLQNGGQMTRTIEFTPDEETLIRGALWKTPEYVKLVMHLPDETGTPVIITDLQAAITAKQARQVYASLRQEIAGADPDKWIREINEANAGMTGAVCSLQLETLVGSDRYGVTLPITDTTPNTLELYLNLARENVSFEKWEARHPLSLPDNPTAASCDLTFSIWDAASSDGIPSDGFYISSDMLYDDEGRLPAENKAAWTGTIEWLRAQAKKPIDIHKPYGRVDIWCWSTIGFPGSVTFFCPMDEMPEAVKTLRQIATEYDEEYDEEVWNDIITDATEALTPLSATP